MARCRTTGSREPLLEPGIGTDTSVNVLGCSEGARKLIVGIIPLVFKIEAGADRLEVEQSKRNRRSKGGWT